MAARRSILLLPHCLRSVTALSRNLVRSDRILNPVCSYPQLHTSSIRLANSAFTVVNVQDEKDFEEKVVQSKVPVVLDFHATWCGPCKLLAPRLEGVLSKQSKPVNLVKVDVDNFEDLAIQYKVQGVPAVFAVKDGKVVDKFVGLKEEDIIEGFVERLLT